ncbi:hypothetical protein DMENIID0001_107830 [Sergentomyia squamirostris]
MMELPRVDGVQEVWVDFPQGDFGVVSSRNAVTDVRPTAPYPSGVSPRCSAPASLQLQALFQARFQALLRLQLCSKSRLCCTAAAPKCCNQSCCFNPLRMDDGAFGAQSVWCPEMNDVLKARLVTDAHFCCGRRRYSLMCVISFIETSLDILFNKTGCS